jgi:hypothetical protein
LKKDSAVVVQVVEDSATETAAEAAVVVVVDLEIVMVVAVAVVVVADLVTEMAEDAIGMVVVVEVEAVVASRKGISPRIRGHLAEVILVDQIIKELNLMNKLN